MQTKNNYSLEGYDSACKQKFKGVFNGDIGSICKILPDKLCVDYDGRIVEYSKTQLGDLELAYAITIHKSMGSEYETDHHSHFDGAPHFADEESDLYRRDTRKEACHSGWPETCAVSGRSTPAERSGEIPALPSGS